MMNKSEKFLVFKANNECHRLAVGAVTYFKADQKFVDVYMDDDHVQPGWNMDYFTSPDTLKHYEEQMEQLGEKFLRVHRSYLVRVSEIVSLKRTTADRWIVVLDNKRATEVPVARRRLPEVRAIFKRLTDLANPQE